MKLSRQLREERAFVEISLGDSVICRICSASLKTYADACTAGLQEQCPGFVAIEQAKKTFADSQTIADLRKLLAHYEWRPIAKIHEDFGPCVLMNINDPGYMEVGSNLSTDYDESKWTHFAEVPKLTSEQAEKLILAMDEQVGPCNDCGVTIPIGDELCGACHKKQLDEEQFDDRAHRCPPRE